MIDAFTQVDQCIVPLISYYLYYRLRLFYFNLNISSCEIVFFLLIDSTKGPFIFNVGCMGGVECVWVRNIFRQIFIGTKYFQKLLYGYEIIFYKFGQKFLDRAQFLDFINFRKRSVKET